MKKNNSNKKTNALTPAQKKLPPAIQNAIMSKGKSKGKKGK